MGQIAGVDSSNAARAGAAAYGTAATQKGARAGESFPTDAEKKRKEREDKFRVEKRKSFAWGPKAGDKEWEDWNKEQDAKESVGAKAQPIIKTGM